MKDANPMSEKTNPEIYIFLKWSKNSSKSLSAHSPIIKRAEAHNNGKKWNLENCPIIPLITSSSFLKIVFTKNITHPQVITINVKMKQI